MESPARRLSLLLPFFLAPAAVLAQEPVEHLLEVRLEPAAHALEVRAALRLPSDLRAAGTTFELADALELRESEPEVRPVGEADGGVRSYELLGAAPSGWLRLEYAGRLDHDLSDQKEEYTRGFRETLGRVGPEGVYLAGSTRWVPTFDGRMLSFELEVRAPEGWHVISQGSGSSGDGDGRARWSSPEPMEEVYLVGGPLLRFADSAGSIETLVYLHEPDEALALKYLDTTARYLEMYRGLFGPYPYDKFALVENFWETGYGMPSFTLLGEQVIRFPFILHSSYPHEILHNYWGNGVFVDYESGNWCEGLTAYLADHLVQEQRGQGALYRRSTLQKYRDYVKEGRDFPLREFRSRHSAATEAVGYGKALMGFHMLRRRFGDELFVRSLRRFYEEHRGERASFDDLRAAFEAEGREELGEFFTGWLERTGAPALRLTSWLVQESEDGGYWVQCKVSQVQGGEPFPMQVPIVVSTESGPVRSEFSIAEGDAESLFVLSVESRPLGVAVDPDFDTFRLLDPRETPPSIGQIFGQPEILAVLPAEADEATRELYRELVEAWRSDEHAIEVLLDSEVEALPADRCAWILGAENRFAAALVARRGEVKAEATTIELAGETVSRADHSIVVIDRHPANLELAVGWILLDPVDARDGLVRKLPHYGKYSYLAFEGTEPTNVVKGQWEAVGSPLVASLGDGPPASFAMEPPAALAELPAAFSQRELMAHVEWLADPAREGRGLGSDGLRASADYVAAAFEAMGLEPADAEGSWFQPFTVAEGPDGEPVEARNVVGVLRGSGAVGGSVLLSAHLDHLGRGWPDVHSGDEGLVHPGANDNASGVAVMLELVRNLAAQGTGKRDLVVVAFSAEEAGLAGSRYYVQHPVRPLEETLGVINLDAVGLLGDAPITIFGTGTAYEWPHVFRGCGFVTGIASKNVRAGAEGSDQWSFIEAGIPAVQIFCGAGDHYHRPGDTAEQVDAAGLVRVATFLKEAVVYMLDREEPFQVTIEGAARPAAAATSSARRGVSFGSIPEYGYDQGGMLLAGVSEGSPAERAGLRAGDVLIRIDEHAIENTRGFANVLKILEPGQKVLAVVRRDGRELELRVTVVAR